MAKMLCPNCHTQIEKPSNSTGWIVAILGGIGLMMVGGFLLIIVCLATISTIGANAEAEAQAQFESIEELLDTEEVSVEVQSAADGNGDFN